MPADRENIVNRSAVVCASRHGIAGAVLGILVLTWAARAEPLAITYRLPRDARVSLAVTDTRGRILRELLHGASRPTGRHTETWNGLDDEGRPLAAGSYLWKLLATGGLRAEYMFTLGSNQHPLHEPWPGNHNGVTAVAVEETGLYVGTCCGEATPLAVKIDLAGRRLWTIPRNFTAWQGPIAMGVTTSGGLFMLEQGGKLHQVNAHTGEHRTGWDINWSNESRAADADRNGQFLDMDARGDQVVVAFRRHDAVRWYDPQTGRVVDQIAVPAPRAISIGAEGRAYAVSGDKVVAFSREKRAPVTVVSGLIHPARLAVDPGTGEIFVASSSPDCRIRRYAADGRLRNTYGREGGRGYGRYVATDFRWVVDLAALPDGRFVVAEPCAPRRAAIFRLDGTLEREWYGGMMYANYAAPQPGNPEMVWMSCSWGEQMQASVDWVHRTWKPHAIYGYRGVGEGLIGGGWPYFNWIVRKRDGKLYLCRENDPAILEVDETNGRLVPRLISYNAFHVWRDTRPPIIRAAMARRGMAEGDSPFFAWNDDDRDGTVRLEEIRPLVGSYPIGPAPWIAPDLSYWTVIQAYKLPAPHTCVLVRPLLDWQNGVPRMGWKKGERYPLVDPLPAEFEGAGPRGLTRDRDGSVFVAFIKEHKQTLRKWSVGRIAKFGPDGALRWVVGRPASGARALPGETKSICRVLAPVHGCVMATDVFDSMVHVWDRDGLWVGRLMDHPNLDAAPQGAYEVGCENFGGATFVVPDDCRTPGLTPGEVLYFGCTANATPVYRITGWDRFERQEGGLVITPEQAARLRARDEQREQRQSVVRIPYRRNITIDGVLDDWPESRMELPPARGGAAGPPDPDAARAAEGIEDLLDQGLKPGGGKTAAAADRPLGARQIFIRSADAHAAIYLAWNEHGLVAAYDVTTPAPWKSSNVNPALAFQGGAAVDLSFGAELPERDAPVPGDRRVVAAPVQGATVAVEFCPVLPEGMDAKNPSPATYESGVGKITFAHVAPLPADHSACRVKPGGNGYVVELRAPWREPLEPRVGARLRLDVSLILANRDGTRSERRTAWQSRELADTTTHDTYTEATPRPRHWGEAVLEP